MATLILFKNDIKEEVKNSRGKIIDVVAPKSFDHIIHSDRIDTILYKHGKETVVCYPDHERFSV